MAKPFVFNNGWSQSGGLSRSLSCATTFGTVGDDGESTSAGTERYTRAQRLLCGTPAIVQRADGASDGADNYFNHQMYALAGGFAHDSSTPLFVQMDATHAFLLLRQTDFGSGNVLNSWHLAGYLASSAKRGQIDLLKDSAFEETGYIYDPNPGFAAYTICHGLVVAICQQKQDLGALSFNWSAATPSGGGVYILTSSTAPSGWDARQGDQVFLASTGGAVTVLGITPGSSVTILTSTAPLSSGTGTIPRWKSVGTAVCAYQHGHPRPRNGPAKHPSSDLHRRAAAHHRTRRAELACEHAGDCLGYRRDWQLGYRPDDTAYRSAETAMLWAGVPVCRRRQHRTRTMAID